MIRTLTATLVLTLSVVSLALAQDYRLEETQTLQQTLRFAGSGDRTLTIRNLAGSIRVTGGGGDAVQMSMRRTIHADSRGALQRGLQATTLRTSDGGLSVEAVVVHPDGPPCDAGGDLFRNDNRRGRRNRNERPEFIAEYDFDVTVPPGTRLVLCTVNGREVVVTGTRGNFNVSNVNGRIELRDVRGEGSAVTVNGPVEATLLQAPRANATFKTVNGRVMVTWPGDLAADLWMKTFNGRLTTDFESTPITRQAPAGRRSGGGFVYRSDGFSGVRVGRGSDGGGPEITLETLNGDVQILKAR